MKVVLFANTDWYLYNFRRSLATAMAREGFEVVLLSPPGPYGPRLEGLGFRWVSVPMLRSSLNPVREAMLVVWLFRFLRREKVDLLHGFTIKCAVYGAIAARLAGLRAWVSSVAGLGYVFISDSLKARALRPVVRALIRFALNAPNARLILQNPDDLGLFCRARLVDPGRIRMIRGSGVNCERFSPGPPRDARQCLRVLLPARLLWDKGVGEFVEAARRLRGAGREVEFLLAGDPDPGNPASIPRTTIEGWVAEGLVKWLGHVDDMPELFRQVDVVALPSYREGLPKGLIEAGACGLALVATDVPGCREVVDHEVDGLLVPMKDAKALGEAIGRLRDDDKLLERLGVAARSKALGAFDENLINAETLAVYREVLEASSVSRAD